MTIPAHEPTDLLDAISALWLGALSASRYMEVRSQVRELQEMARQLQVTTNRFSGDTRENEMSGSNVANTALMEIIQADESAVMRTLAERIARNASPEEAGRLGVADAIARYLELGWPSAEAVGV